MTFSEEATNDGLPFLSTNSQNLPIDNLNSQDQTVSPKNLQKSAKKIVLEVFWRIKVVFNRGKIKKKSIFFFIFAHVFAIFNGFFLRVKYGLKNFAKRNKNKLCSSCILKSGQYYKPIFQLISVP